MVGLVLLLLATMPAAAQVVGDDFDDNVTGRLWFPVATPPSSIAETNQSVVITHPAAAASAFGAGNYFGACALRGNFDIQVDFDLLIWPPPRLDESGSVEGNGVRVGLNTALGTVERTSFGMQGDFAGQPRNVYLTNFADGIQGIVATGDLVGKLRQERIGTTVNGYYFDVGIDDWVLINSAAATDADAWWNLASWNNGGNQLVQVAFDNFWVNEGTLVCAPVQIDIRPRSDRNWGCPRSC